MAGTPNASDLERLLAERGRQLMQVAIALAGSRQAGEDLLQAALERVLRKPCLVDSDTEGYLRRVLYNLAADGWRRRGRWRERLPLLRTEEDRPAAGGTDVIDLRDALVRLLRQLPPRQRAVIVLRYWNSAPRARPPPCSAARRARSSRLRPAGCGGCVNWPAPAPNLESSWRRDRHDR